MGPAAAVARRAFGEARVSTAAFGLGFGVMAYAQVAGYAASFPTHADRVQFAQSFGDAAALRMFYGFPHDLLTVGGYAAWRAGGVLAIVAAVWGLLAAIRATRAEEESGRQELVLGGAVGRRGAYLAALAAIAGGAAILGTAMLAGLVAGGLPLGGSAYLALATGSVVPVFAGIGALASQLAPTRRMATGLATGALAIAFLLRVVADTSAGLAWLRWATPLGWAEELRPFTGARPAVLALPLLAGAALLTVAGMIAARRDIGSGLLAARDGAQPQLALLSSPTALALRGARGGLLGWLAGIATFALVVGALATTVSTARLSSSLQEQLDKVGGATIATASGYIGLTFLFFVLALSLFACSQVAAARREEADQRLETLFALPAGRRGWLGGRLALGAVATAVLALAAGVLTWAGAASQNAGVSLAQLLGAGANCLPAALLFGALGALAFAVLPRASIAIAYGVVAVAFVWELAGALLGAPSWALGLSPFHHVGLVPAQPFEAGAAGAMVALAACAALAAVWAFERRDLTAA